MALLALFGITQTVRYEHARTRIAVVQSEFDAYKTRIATQAAADNQAAIAALKAAQAWQDAALAQRLQQMQQQNAQLQTRLMEIANVPAEQDGPVADVLCATFGRLWRTQPCAAAERRH
jgi:hypothetical protein